MLDGQQLQAPGIRFVVFENVVLELRDMGKRLLSRSVKRTLRLKIQGCTFLLRFRRSLRRRSASYLQF